jgi:hypothetical protein
MRGTPESRLLQVSPPGIALVLPDPEGEVTDPDHTLA